MTAEEQAAALVCGRLKPENIADGARVAVIAALVALLQAADDRIQTLMADERGEDINDYP